MVRDIALFLAGTVGALRRTGFHGLRVLLVALFLLSAALHAQSTASLTGVVKDVDGAIVPGAKVVLTNRSDKSVRSTISSGDAFFSFTAVQPGTYTLTITRQGFETYTVTGIELHPSDSKSVETIKLKVGSVQEVVTVTSTVAGVDLSSPEKSSLITDEDIKRLSTVGRDVSELIKFLPGFAVSPGGSLANTSTNNNSQVMGFGSSSVSSFSANGSTPQTGQTAVLSDGASVMDPGDMGASITNINMEMVQEVKVQTSNFGADSAKGPVVLAAVSKSGGSDYHGSGYFYARNYELNSNDWLSNYFGTAKAQSSNYFPGANIGGPVKIPGTSFNHSKKLTFWTGFEDYQQQNLNTLATSFVPTARMLAGDLSNASIEQALNIPTGQAAISCPTFYTDNGLPNSGGFCFQPSGVTVQGDTISNGQIPTADIDPNVAAFEKFYPKPNRTPQMVGNPGAPLQAGYVPPAGTAYSDGYNYVKNILANHNGFQYHARVDQNFSDRTKLYVTYNFEQINDENPVTDVYYAGSDIIPAPSSAFSHAHAHTLTLNLTHIFGPTLTNELVGAGAYFYEPVQLGNRAQILDSATGFQGPRFYNNGYNQLPGLVDYEEGVPDFGMGSFPVGGAYLRKYSTSVSDNLSKQIQRHSLKVGVYAEISANNQVPYAYAQGDLAYNHYDSACNVYNQVAPTAPTQSQLYNNIGNFLNGCANFTQTNSFPAADMNFKTLDFYATDEWKVNKHLMLTLGIRFEHLGPWVDAHGTGLAVWTDPPAGTYNAALNQNDPRTWPGITWHQVNKDIPLSGSPSRAVFYSPRVGLSYDLKGDGSTTFRGGWGAYRFHDAYNDPAGALQTTLGVATYTTPTNTSCTLQQIGNSAPGVTVKNLGNYGPGQTCESTSQSGASPFTLYALDEHDNEQPVTYNYNFTVDQKMPGSSILEMSYVGNQSAHTLTQGNLSNQNYIPLGALFQPDPVTKTIVTPGTANLQDYRPYRNYNAVYVKNHIGYGNYNGLQVSWNKQRGAFIYGANYTWEKALGIRGDYRSGVAGDPSNLRNNYGLLGFNRNQILNFTFSYQEGNLYHGQRLLRDVLNQWEVSGITGLQSGPDVAVISSPNFNLSGGYSYEAAGTTTPVMVTINNTNVLGTPDFTLQPIVTCNPTANLPKSNGTTKQFINGNCFALPPAGSNGSYELPDVHGPAYFNSDLTIFRNFKIGEKQGLQFRLAGFNFLNHPLWQLYGGPNVGLSLNYGLPSTTTTNGVAAPLPTTSAAAYSQLVQTSNNFGATSYKAGNRIVEVGAKYTF